MTTIVSGSSITFNDNTTQNTSAYGGGFAFRNRIINGDMRIDQRNAGASVTPTTDLVYNTVDRWQPRLSASSKYSLQQNAGSVTPPTGFTNYLGVTSLAATSVAATDYYAIEQKIEGFNTADLSFGTANAQTVTLSFWVRSSLTGTFGGNIRNSLSDYCYPFSYTISSANTWEKKTVTIAGATAGTWIGATNGIGMNVAFNLGVGSTYTGTANAWYASTIINPTGATSVVGTNGATFYITGVQLEKGSTATSFDYRPYGQELALCQRYAQKVSSDATAVYVRFCSGFNQSTTTGNFSFPFKVSMRAAPTLTTTGTASNYAIYSGSASVNALTSVPSVGTDGTTTESASIAAGTTGLTAGSGAILISNNVSTAFLLFTSEL